ncbi:hypothetical protein B9G98_01119 [Wickerhamiella sorbophila]|uniref:Uncharacterized protein n=1 Tax=Wickerhamiella sorbophila TaxID=45607 RepID=A0A2T0FEV9_9ASCO|nr:hypothetical protein B9G98_01119 [Wickerhamiella sorbophila]PRT53499.1 hypothetical protein B9G98_01119 [Wickerhamiella sorbophila]
MGGEETRTAATGLAESELNRSAPQTIPERKGFFGWVSQTLSPTAAKINSTSEAVAPPPGPSSEPVPKVAPLSVGSASRPTSEAIAEMGPVRNPSTRRTRRDSSVLTHDEALNISRAGFSPPASNPGANAMARNRQRSNSKYDKLGLMAAYSGGPSSF